MNDKSKSVYDNNIDISRSRLIAGSVNAQQGNLQYQTQDSNLISNRNFPLSNNINGSSIIAENSSSCLQPLQNSNIFGYRRQDYVSTANGGQHPK